jgi:tetratricopeptide (TPR) repeat protein
MSAFQFITLTFSIVLFYLFFKEITSQAHEVEKDDKKIQNFSELVNSPQKSQRVEELIAEAKEFFLDREFEKAQKALLSASIIEPKNPDVLRGLGVASLELGDYKRAKNFYENLLSIKPNDDLGFGSLANTLHKLGEDEEAIKNHQKAIELDPDYAPHHFNYANTLYDLKRFDEALESYKKAYSLDNSLKEAKEMILKSKRGNS